MMMMMMMMDDDGDDGVHARGTPHVARNGARSLG